MQQSPGMLSAKELLLIRQSKAKPRSLPQVPPKDFVPTGSQEEATIIDGIIQSKIQFLKDERAERRNLLVTAEWLHDNGLARVTKKAGGDWSTFGYEEDGSIFIYPEEALFLLENSKLELYYDGTPISIQQAYQLLLKEKYCIIDNYVVYSHLSRLGYRLRRKIPSTKSKLRRTDDTIECGSVPKKVKLDLSTSFLLPATNSEDDPDYILNLGDNSSHQIVNIPFPPAALLPESIRDRKGSISYVVNPRNSSLAGEDVQHDVSIPVTSHSTPLISKARNWAEYKTAERTESQPQVDYSNNPLYQGLTKPLIPANFKGNLMDRLRMLSFSPITEFDSSDEAGLPIVYEVYSPGRPYRKSNPGNPCYLLAITRWDMPFPSLAQQECLKREANDRGSMVLIAVVGKGSGVSFYQIVPMVSPFSA